MMKSVIFSSFVVLQALFIAVLVVLFERVDETGTEITVVTVGEETYDYKVFGPQDVLYKRYNITEVPEDKWEIDEELKYNETVYVTLTKNEADIHEIKRVTKKEPKTVEKGDVVVLARYDYENEKGLHELRYGFELLEHVDRFGEFYDTDKLEVTILLGKLNQKKIKKIEKIDADS